MIRLLLWPLFLLPLMWLAWHALHAPPSGRLLDNGVSLEWVDCWFDKPLLRPVFCARLRTADEASAESFSLPVVYLPAGFWQRSDDPVLYIAGGPGGATSLDRPGVDNWLDWAEQVGWQRDLVFYDQRGVGLSEPSLSCPELINVRRELLPLDLPPAQALRKIRDQGVACFERLRAQGVDFRRFTSRHNAQDARDLMLALGFEQWNVYGVSYGTRVALDLMRIAPQQIRAAVLDSVYPPQVNPELQDAWLLYRALGLFARICDLSIDCETDRGLLDNALQRALSRLTETPLRVTVPDPEGGQPLQVVYRRDDLAWLVFEVLYRWQSIGQLPAVIQSLSEDRVTPMLRDFVHESMVNLLDDSMSDAVASAVDCNDASVISERQMADSMLAYPRVAKIKEHGWRNHACRFWKTTDSGEEFRQPVRSGVPTLLLAGEFDPVTPPHWAEQALETLSRGFLFEFPLIGHGVLDSHLCALDLTGNFLQKPGNPQPPACLQNL